MPPLALTALVALPGVALQPAALSAQSDGWNAPQALELIERARERRAHAYGMDGLFDYQADARGYVYFYVDFTDTDERHLVRTDQLALDVYWRAPGMTKQVIVGRRHRETLPTNIRYYTDRLVAVLDNFGDHIVIADGDNVRDVLHPAATNALDFYDVRLADRVTLRLPGAPEPVRVQEVRVRPKDPSQPAFVGSLFLDEATADIVRMEFGFTPAAYVDPQVDRIRISLEHAFWEGRYWLPHEQRMEVRRELPQLDLPAGTVIRARMRMSNYRINEGVPASVFVGPPVVTRPESERRAFPFEQEIFEELHAEGLSTVRDPAALRERAERLARQHALSGLPAFRVRLPAASDVLRYNRAEGVTVGGGVSFAPGDGTDLRLHGGWAFGAEHPIARAEIRNHGTLGAWTLGAHLNEPIDMGFRPVISGAMNTATAFLGGRDFTDLFYATGITLGGERRLDAAWRADLGASLERQRSAERTTTFSAWGSGLDRPVAEAADAGVLQLHGRLRGGTDPEEGRPWRVDLRPRVARWASDDEQGWSTGLLLEGSRGRRWIAGDAVVTGRLAGGAVIGTPLPQQLFRVGGRGTVPGHPFRSLVGDRMVLADVEGARDLAWPWLRGRMLAAAGWMGASEDRWHLPANLSAPVDHSGAAASVGIGAGLFYDIIRVDLHRGFGARGGWEIVVDTKPGFWGFL